MYSFVVKSVTGARQLFLRLLLNDTSTAKVSEEVNTLFPPRNTTGQLSAPYTDPECHSTHRHCQTDRLTDRWTDNSTNCTMPIASTIEFDSFLHL